MLLASARSSFASATVSGCDTQTSAIAEGKLRLDQVHDWLEEVEGWGEQHVYLYEVPDEILADSRWQSPEALRACLPGKQQKLWNPQKLLSFPANPTLTGIFNEPDSLQYVWHSGYEVWQKAPERDYQDTIEGELYKFLAFRQRQDRKVRRFVLRKDLRLAGIFLQTEWSEKENGEAIAEIKKTVTPVIPFDKLRQISMLHVIKQLDQLDLEAHGKTVQSQKTRLADAGAYVEFASTTEAGYMDSAEVRRVRNSVRADSAMIGANGTFVYPSKTPTGLDRPVKFDVFGEQRRVKLRSQLTASDVWALLSLLKQAEGRNSATAGAAS